MLSTTPQPPTRPQTATKRSLRKWSRNSRKQIVEISEQLEQNRGQSAVLEKTLSEYRESREKLEKQCIELQQTIFANQQEKNNLNEQIKNNEKAINALKNQNLSKMSNSEEQGIIEFRLLYLSFDAYHLFFSFFYFL